MKTVCKDCVYVWTYKTGTYCFNKESIIDPHNIKDCKEKISREGKSLCDMCKCVCPRGGSIVAQCNGFKLKESEAQHE